MLALALDVYERLYDGYVMAALKKVSDAGVAVDRLQTRSDTHARMREFGEHASGDAAARRDGSRATHLCCTDTLASGASS